MSFKLKELCLEVTNSCPMECQHCSTCSVKIGKGKPYHMPISVAKRVIQDFVDVGGEILEISGGEPLIYLHLDELCQHAANLNLEVRL